MAPSKNPSPRKSPPPAKILGFRKATPETAGGSPSKVNKGPKKGAIDPIYAGRRPAEGAKKGVARPKAKKPAKEPTPEPTPDQPTAAQLRARKAAATRKRNAEARKKEEERKAGLDSGTPVVSEPKKPASKKAVAPTTQVAGKGKEKAASPVPTGSKSPSPEKPAKKPAKKPAAKATPASPAKADKVPKRTSSASRSASRSASPPPAAKKSKARLKPEKSRAALKKHYAAFQKLIKQFKIDAAGDYDDVLKAHQEAEAVMELNFVEDPTPSPTPESPKKKVDFKDAEDDEEREVKED